MYRWSGSTWVAYTDTSALQTWINGAYASTIQTIKGQIDGKAETYHQSADPSDDWTSAEYANHTGDLWYDTSDGTTYYWNGAVWVSQDVPDEVFDAIDGKAQIFVSQPTTPYNVGDLWFNSATSDIMTCITARTSGNYTASDWQKRNKYTDDTAVTTLNTALNQTEIFNRLTNNGAIQGIYMQNGQLYINANYIQTGTMSADRILGGTLKLGGNNNASGVLGVYNASGVLVGTFDKDGLKCILNNTIFKFANNNVYDPAHLITRDSNVQAYDCITIDGKAPIQDWANSIKIIPSCDFENYFVANDTNSGAIVSDNALWLRSYTKTLATGGVVKLADDGTHIGVMRSTSGGLIALSVEKNGIYVRRRWNNTDKKDYTLAASLTITTYSSSECELYIAGTIRTASGNVAIQSSSSRRYKHSIAPIESEELDPHKLLSLPIVQFEWNDGHPLQYEDMRGQTIPGIIAEDVEEIYPAATIHDPEGRVESWDERRLIPGMLALIQEQDKKIKELEARLAKIEEMLK